MGVSTAGPPSHGDFFAQQAFVVFYGIEGKVTSCGLTCLYCVIECTLSTSLLCLNASLNVVKRKNVLFHHAIGIEGCNSLHCVSTLQQLAICKYFTLVLVFFNSWYSPSTWPFCLSVLRYK